MPKTAPRASKTPRKQGSESKSENATPPDKTLRQIAAALGFLVLQGSSYKDAKNPEKIAFLTKFGFDRFQIAAIIDSTPGTVSKEQSILRSSKGKEEEPSE
ncbi:MAG: hypothetical protein ACUVV3_10755 [Dehalococcoidia bacterium]